ncbi:phosphatidylinositol-glycan biosynthesis class F protein [Copidosoma floridanum]|uniref:phosphatidylinositol-glycan biosynthesis class F protein n=1 Tax=Copidosoma floridanum TaxID=29053 RepID=UPI0006C9E09B|nr:phosphatidylinositol-glycan biosynthesis class F protein [Copidosoma floridanum]
MDVKNIQNRRVWVGHCLVICIHFVGILSFIHFNKYFYSIGFYKYILLLATVFLADLLKYLLVYSQLKYISVEKEKLNYLVKVKKSSKIMKNTLKFVLTAVGITIVYHIVIVLFGAPLIADYEKTFVLAATLTMLTLVPASLYIGINNVIDLLIGHPAQIERSVIDGIKLNVKTVLFGTWISTFVLPLDWDQPWQAWPIPCIIGAMLSYSAAHFIGLMNILIVKFKRRTRKIT